MIFFENHISKCNRLSKNIRPIQAIEVLYRLRNEQKHYLIYSKTPCITYHTRLKTGLPDFGGRWGNTLPHGRIVPPPSRPAPHQIKLDTSMDDKVHPLNKTFPQASCALFYFLLFMHRNKAVVIIMPQCVVD